MSELCFLFIIYCVARARQSSMMRESAIEREPKVGWSTLQSWDSRSQNVFLMGWKKVMLSRACGIWSVYPLWNWVWSPATPNIMLAVSSRFFSNGCCLPGCPYNLSRYSVSIKISDQNVYRYCDVINKPNHVITPNVQFFWCNYLSPMVAELYSGTTGDAITVPRCIHNRYTTWGFYWMSQTFLWRNEYCFWRHHEGWLRIHFFIGETGSSRC